MLTASERLEATRLPYRNLFRILENESSLRHLGVILILGCGVVSLTAPQIHPGAAQEIIDSIHLESAHFDGDTESATPLLDRHWTHEWGLRLGWETSPFRRLEAYFIPTMLAVSVALMLFGLFSERLLSFRGAAWTVILCLSSPIIMSQMQSTRPIGFGMGLLAATAVLLGRKPGLETWKNVARWMTAGACLAACSLLLPSWGLFAAVLLGGHALISIFSALRDEDAELDSDVLLPILIVGLTWFVGGGWWFGYDFFANGSRGLAESFWETGRPLEQRASRAALLLLLISPWPLVAYGVTVPSRNRSAMQTVGLRILLSGLVILIISVTASWFMSDDEQFLAGELLVLLSMIMAFFAGRGINQMTTTRMPPLVLMIVLGLSLGHSILAVSALKQLSGAVRLTVMILTAGALIAVLPAAFRARWRPVWSDRVSPGMLVLLVVTVPMIASIALLRIEPPWMAAIDQMDRQISDRKMDSVWLLTSRTNAEPLMLALHTRWPDARMNRASTWTELELEETPRSLGDSVFVLAWGRYEVRPSLSRFERPLIEVLRPFYLLDEPVRGFRTKTFEGDETGAAGNLLAVEGQAPSESAKAIGWDQVVGSGLNTN